MYPLGGAPPPKKIFWGKIFSQPLRVRGVVQNFPGNNPRKEVLKTGFKIWGAPPKKFAGESKLAQILRFSNFFAHFSKTVRDIANLKTNL